MSVCLKARLDLIKPASAVKPLHTPRRCFVRFPRTMLVGASVLFALLFVMGSAKAQRMPGPMPRPPVALSLPMSSLGTLESIRREQRMLRYQEAVEALRKDPTMANLSPCGNATTSACLPEPVALQSSLPIDTAEISTPAPDRASEVREFAAAPTRRLALLIGNNAYRKPIPALETPIADVRRLGALLAERFGYQIRILTDASRADLVGALSDLVQASEQAASVLIVYAGHGYLVEALRRGFWIPSDANAKDPSGWLANDDILRFFKALRSRQSMLISDSCFSGSLIPADASRWLGNTPVGSGPDPGRAAVIMSSGGDEPVSDEGFDGHSIFAWYLIQSLGRQSTPVSFGAQSFDAVQNGVRKHYPQTPRYGAIPAAGHRLGADFVFLMGPVNP
jgi:hypothetical protein